jgi:Flp pilus assembly protein TadG
MSRFKLLRRDEQGAAAIEFAIAVPVLILLIYGIFRIGLLFQANAGMQHALGEGARYATLYPTPTDAQIQTRMTSRLFGKGYGTFTVAAPVNSTGYKTLTVTYTTPMDFLFVPGPTVTVSRTKRVYVAI